MVFRSELKSRRDSLLRSAGEWTERITILLLLLFTVAGLCSVAVTGLEVARGQLRWPYSMMLFMVALLGLPLSIAWILMLCRKSHVWSRTHVARFAAV